MEKDQLVLSTENTLLAENASSVNAFLKSAISENTRRAYRSDWEDFVEWCSKVSVRAMPATGQNVAIYLARLADSGNYKATTITRKAIAIGQAHQSLNEESPTKTRMVRTVLRGIRRELGVEPEKARPTMVHDIRDMVDWISNNYDLEVLAERDRALLLLGFAGAFRRSELVSLNVEDIEFVEEGLIVRLHGSKTDQEKKGEAKGIPLATPRWCPVLAVENWIISTARTKGPLFIGMDRWGNLKEHQRLSDKAVARIVKKAAKGIGHDPRKYSGHSLRSGLATAAAVAGKSERSIMKQTGHRSVVTVREYIREGHLFRGNAAEGLL